MACNIDKPMVEQTHKNAQLEERHLFMVQPTLLPPTLAVYLLLIIAATSHRPHLFIQIPRCSSTTCISLKIAYFQFFFFFFFSFLRNKYTPTKEREIGSNTKAHHNFTQKQLHSKAMVTFKRGQGKLYCTQRTLLSNVGQLPFFFFFFEKQTHTHKGEEIGF